MLLTKALEENGEVMMVVKCADISLPENLVAGCMVNRDGQVSTIVEASELGSWDLSFVTLRVDIGTKEGVNTAG